MSQLGLGLGLSNVSSLLRFSPLDLDPYLLFDTQSSMIGTFENPTLDLDPANPSTLDVITATRAGVATYTDADGLIQSAAPNTTRVDYTQGAELTPTKFQNIGYTDFSNSYWIARGFTKVGTVDGPLGYTGYEFLENNTNSNPAILPNADLSDGSPITFSVWLKATSPISIPLATTGSVKTSTINITTEWQFFQCTDSSNSTFGPHIGGFNTITQGSGVTLFAAMPQLEEGTTASSFVANTTGSPKFITGATYGPRVPMILVEPSATNLLTATQEASSWSSTNVSVTSNTTTAPDGSQTGDTVTRTAGGGADVRQTKAVTSGTSYTMSIFAKAGTDNQIQLDFSNSSMGADNVEFNTRTGQKVSGSANYSITELSNGWRRYSFTSTCISSGNTGLIIRIENDEPVELWGFQFEEGSVATSYIPHTSGSIVTRAADDLVISGSDFSDFYNATEGTIYVELQSKVVADTVHTRFSFNDGTNGNSMYSLLSSNHDLLVKFGGNSTGYSSQSNVLQANEYHRLAASYIVNNFITSRNGSLSSTQPATQPIPPVNRLVLGAIENNTRHLNGHIKRLIYWPYHSDSL